MKTSLTFLVPWPGSHDTRLENRYHSPEILSQEDWEVSPIGFDKKWPVLDQRPPALLSGWGFLNQSKKFKTNLAQVTVMYIHQRFNFYCNFWAVTIFLESQFQHKYSFQTQRLSSFEALHVSLTFEYKNKKRKNREKISEERIIAISASKATMVENVIRDMWSCVWCTQLIWVEITKLHHTIMSLIHLSIILIHMQIYVWLKLLNCMWCLQWQMQGHTPMWNLGSTTGRVVNKTSIKLYVLYSPMWKVNNWYGPLGQTSHVSHGGV